MEIKQITINDSEYPKLLTQIPDPPKVLFYRGNLECLNAPTIAVVGARKHTDYGRLVCEKIIAPLARQGITIISGLALGIDGIAHQATLDNYGKTAAVLGTGIDKETIYPATNRALAENIIKNNGVLISEYEPGFKATAYSFPRRNRIIAGLSLGVLVIEAAEKSGALITASRALDYNRDVFAIPHQINSPTGAGANNLIKQGARLVTNAHDILETLNIRPLPLPRTQQKNASKKTAGAILTSDPAETKILACLSAEPISIDKIIENSRLDSATVNGKLILMEIKGLIKNTSSNFYIINF